MALSSYLRNALLEHVLHGTPFTQPTTIFISVHNGDPGLTGVNEAAGGSYARQSATSGFATVVNGAKSSNTVFDYVNMPAGTWSYIGIWDASSAGNFLWGMPLTSPKTTNAGDTLRFPSGNITGTMT